MSIQVSDQLIDVSNGKVYVKQWTFLSQEAPIILLHDSLGCTDLWRDFPQRLAERLNRTVISYDRLGFGKSSARTELPSPRFVGEETEILPHLLKALQIKNFMLLGHSVGGAMALVCAGHFQNQCIAVITESAQAFVEQRTRQGILAAQKHFARPEVFAKLEKYHGEKTQWVLDAWIKVWLSDEFARWSLADDLSHVKCPVLVIHGEQDEYGSVAFPKMIAQSVRGPRELHLLSGFGHVPHRENPGLVLDLIEGFSSPLNSFL